MTALEYFCEKPRTFLLFDRLLPSLPPKVRLRRAFCGSSPQIDSPPTDFRVGFVVWTRERMAGNRLQDTVLFLQVHSLTARGKAQRRTVMRSSIIATIAMDLVNGRRNGADVAGMIELRERGPQFPRLYTRPVLRATACLSGSESCLALERHQASCRPTSRCSAKRGSHWLLTRPGGAQPSARLA